MLVSSSVGFFTAFRMTYKEKYVILSVSEISHDLSEKYIPFQFFSEILHCVQDDVLCLEDCRGRYALKVGTENYRACGSQ